MCIEEHIKDGGFQSYLRDYYDLKLFGYSLKKTFCDNVGYQDYLVHKYIISEEKLKYEIKALI